MKSITKAVLSNEDIHNIVTEHFGKETRTLAIEELTGGFFNTAYLLTLDNHFKVVLKVSPPHNVKVLRCERNIMKSEIAVLQLLKQQTDIPVPEVYAYHSRMNPCDHDYFLMEYISGVPLDQLYEQLTQEEFNVINQHLGILIKKIHNITGASFGYIFSDKRRFNTWGDAFIAFIRDLILDAAEANIELPIDGTDLINLIKSKKAFLDTVRTPRLVHRDLWWGNIFIEPKTLKITGITDCERSLFGDPLMDFVFGFVVDNKGFHNGYGHGSFSPDETERLNLYTVYSLLLILVEGHYRQLKGNEQEEARVRQSLLEKLHHIERN
ncbi:aminoglycoside phosphotransferase (APT) family kinase protein [Pullulanibacillus pueri]|uniref:Protein kinase domain-containing protein n=1 Tax=Pullulanibacillus pueri TaxID=1437324 RepID=A0A8J2ZU32_9BACL|nr:aminoglycoside phosphotransferase family protein [Pullulanibacillus pueri]MBM7681247.1 aminoglycoside phosphotransferase (APT) family kinase protein [Pullulanibacillus pueri]GGH77891.1 hypothetical protein GCM10007096_10460 [Pullulanibacillus pueri]